MLSLLQLHRHRYHNPSTCFTRVSKPPQTLDELGESLELWSKLDTEKPETEAKFSPLYDQFSILGKYEVPVSDEVCTYLT